MDCEIRRAWLCRAHAERRPFDPRLDNYKMLQSRLNLEG